MNTDKFVYFKSNVSGLVMVLPEPLESAVFFPSSVTPGEAPYGLASIPKGDKERIEAIKKHPKFGKSVFKMDTPAEIAEKKRLEKCAEFADKIKDSLSSGAVSLNLNDLKKDELFAFAEKLGVPTSDSNAEKTKAQVVKEIDKLLALEVPSADEVEELPGKDD